MSFGFPQNFYLGTPGVMGNLTVADKVPQEMLYLVDSHWYQFPPMNPLWHSLLGFALCIFCFIAWLGNLCVVFIFTKTKSLRTPSNLLVVNLAVSDFMIMFTMGPPMIVNCFYETWVFGPLMCQIYGMCGSLFGCISIWTMTMIAFDRYNVIVKGITAKPLTHSGAVMKIFFVWGASLAWTLLPLLGWNRYTPEGNMTACGTDYLTKGWNSRSYVLIYGIWVYFVPLFLIIYSYFFIMQAVSQHEKNMREQARKMNVVSLRSADNQATSVECKLAKVALMTISLWFMAWTPYLIINFASIFELTKITPLGSIWGSVTAKGVSVYNPIVYGISHPKYRAALIKNFPSLSCGGDSVESGDTQSAATGVTTAVVDEKPSA